MATHTYKTLYQGQLPISATVLATVPALKSWIVKDISMSNTDTVDRTAALYKNGTTTAFLITPKAMNIVTGGMWAFNDGTITIEAGGTIAGIASAVSVITVTISGDEVS